MQPATLPELIGDRAFQMMINGASGVYEKETGRERGEGVKRERETVNNETTSSEESTITASRSLPLFSSVLFFRLSPVGTS